MFDTHCHLNFSVFEKNLDAIMASARKSGIERFLVPGTDLVSSKKALEISELYDGVFVAVGIHPTHKLESISLDKSMVVLEELALKSKKVVAIGEIGLDYYHFANEFDSSTRNLQMRFFKEQLRLAVKLGLSVIIHNRLATEDIINTINEVGIANFYHKAVFHCCPPEKQLLDFAMNRKLFIGVDGDITYDSDKAKFVKKIPIELLLIETDSPYLTPKPARDTIKFPNTPSNLIHIVEKITDIKNMTKNAIIHNTNNNALSFLGL